LQAKQCWQDNWRGASDELPVQVKGENNNHTEKVKFSVPA
jgi:hypothetical protein